jgi:hypothetical protein
MLRLLSLGVIVLGFAVKASARTHGVVMILGGAIALCGLAIDARLLMPGTLVAWLALFVVALRRPLEVRVVR